MVPELIRAIMKFVPNYFTWNEERREEYRVHMPEEDKFNIRQFLMSELLDIAVGNDDEMDEAEGHMTEAQWTTINGVILPLQGIGEDYFFLNENFAEGQSTLSFPTLYDYDFADFQFQEEWRKKDILSRISLKTFMADCRKGEQIDHSILIGRIEKEKELMRQFLDKQHADIMANFNDKLIKLTKKNRIILHKDSGLDGLLD